MTLCVFLFLALILSSCSTGIESTKKIKMNKEDLKLMAKSAEQTFSSDVAGSALSSWEVGKPFMAMSDRTLFIFQPSGLSNDEYATEIKGKILRFAGMESQLTPGLSEECILLFSDGANTLRYSTGKSTETALKEIDSSKLPLLSDLALIEAWKEKINGMTLWTRNSLWYDATGERKDGRKFAKVKVLDVMPATGDFPIRVKIEDSDGVDAYLQMNYTSDTHDSRDFAAIFFLNDPKAKYPQISDENWNLIQQGKVAIGMTKDECRLALGNPDDLNSGHSTFQTMDMWQYSNGTFLMFADGILTRFRL